MNSIKKNNLKGEDNSEIFVWGCNSKGQLGLEDTYKYKNILTPIIQRFKFQIKQIACGEDHTAILTSDGLIYTMGSNQFGQLGLGIVNQDVKKIAFPSLLEKLQNQKCIQISCGWQNTLAVMENGDAYVWGKGEYGSLGLGSVQNEFSPQKLNLKGKSVIRISSGARHSALITNDGLVFTFGANEIGQLGQGIKCKNTFEPKQINLQIGQKFVDVCCGTAHTLLLTESGQVYACGNNKLGQLGNGTQKSQSTPQLIEGLAREKVIQISCSHHSGALTSSGNLYIWGTGTFGEYFTPSNILPGRPQIINFSIGGLSGIALDSTGMLYGWGSNTNGQLGLGDTESRKIPSALISLQGQNIKQVVCGINHAIGFGTDANYVIVQDIKLRNNRSPSQKISNYSPARSQSRKKFSSVQFANNFNNMNQSGNLSSSNNKNNLQQSYINNPLNTIQSVQHYQQKQQLQYSQNQSQISRGVDFVSQDPTIEVVLQENKYIENTLRFEKDERRRLEKLNLELRVQIKELQDGKGGLKDLDEKLQEGIDELSQAKNQYQKAQIQINQLQNELQLEQQEGQNAKDRLKRTEEELFETKLLIPQYEERLKNRNNQVISLEEENNKLMDLSKQLEMQLKQSNDENKQKIYELQSQLNREQDYKRKSDNIKEHERLEQIKLEQEKNEIENMYQELERKYASTVLALENEISQKQKIEDGLNLAHQRIISLENENQEYMREITELRRLLYENLELNSDGKSIEVQTLLKVNKEMQLENKKMRQKQDAKQNEYQLLKQKFNALLNQLQHSEYKNLQISQFVDFQHNLSQSQIDIENQNQNNLHNNSQFNNSNININNNYNKSNMNQNASHQSNSVHQSQYLERYTDKQISQLLESANKHAKNMTQIIRNSSTQNVVGNPMPSNRENKFNSSQSHIRVQSPERQIKKGLGASDSDQKLREALDISPQSKKKEGQKEGIYSINEIQSKLEKLQRDKQKLESRIQKYDSQRSNKKSGRKSSTNKKQPFY